MSFTIGHRWARINGLLFCQATSHNMESDLLHGGDNGQGSGRQWVNSYLVSSASFARRSCKVHTSVSKKHITAQKNYDSMNLERKSSSLLKSIETRILYYVRCMN